MLSTNASRAHEDNLIWIDLEMTGLDTDTDSILEIATAVTDRDLNLLAEGPEFAIRHDEATLLSMDDWNRNQHRKSGCGSACSIRRSTWHWRKFARSSFCCNGCRQANRPCAEIRYARTGVSCIG